MRMSLPDLLAVSLEGPAAASITYHDTVITKAVTVVLNFMFLL
jgi:hypothetical protein